ncbi:MAG: O-methyltransferase [Clostridia bacterium]|nr:O-methyltransferase [Clostridia bacterium]
MARLLRVKEYLMDITNPQVQEYIRNLLPVRQGILAEMERDARERKIPIVSPETAMFLYILMKTQRAGEVLEIGTAIGYSTYWLARGVEDTGGRVTAIEISPGNIAEARENWQRLGMKERVELIEGDAVEVLPTLDREFDCIFLDANKSRYPELFSHCYRLLKPGGLWITDNVLFQGQVVGKDGDEPGIKTRPLVAKLKEFINMLTGHPGLETVIVPVGDGMALSYKRGEGNE